MGLLMDVRYGDRHPRGRPIPRWLAGCRPATPWPAMLLSCVTSALAAEADPEFVQLHNLLLEVSVWSVWPSIKNVGLVLLRLCLLSPLSRLSGALWPRARVG